jgi:hypothetical protein
LDAFIPDILALPPGPLGFKHLRPRFLKQQKDAISIYFAPFDWVNKSARVVLVGITPGFRQMVLAFQEARDCLKAGMEPDKAWRQAKERGWQPRADQAAPSMFI